MSFKRVAGLCAGKIGGLVKTVRSFPVDTRAQPDPLVAEAICPIAGVLQKRVSYALPLMAGSHYQCLNLGIPSLANRRTPWIWQIPAMAPPISATNAS